MNALADPFRQLVERRLWPVALLLVAALVAVPVQLSRQGEADVPPPSTAAAPAGPAETESIVSLSDAGKLDRVRAVLGDRKDPFRPARVQRVEKPEESLLERAESAATVDTGALGGTDAGGSGGGGPAPESTAPSGETTAPSGETPTTPSVTPTPAPPKEIYELYSLKVRFGSTDGELTTRTVKRLTGLPGGPRPAVLYLGLLADRKSAVFVVDAGVEVIGDGTCDPSPENCQTLTLKEGETEFLTRGDKQWELDLIDIHTRETTDSAKAARARTAVAAGGREALRKRRARARGYRYSETTGTLSKVKPAPTPARGLKTGASARFAPSD